MSGLPEAHPDDVEVRIGLPVPLDVMATLMNLLGLAYPNGGIKPGRAFERELVLRVPAQDRTARTVSAEEADSARVPADEHTAQLGGWDESGTVSVLPPENLARAFAAGVHAALAANPEAQNYLEWTLHHPDEPGRAYFVYACRSDGQSPHALRVRAEEDLRAHMETCARTEHSTEVTAAAQRLRAKLTSGQDLITLVSGTARADLTVLCDHLLGEAPT